MGQPSDTPELGKDFKSVAGHNRLFRRRAVYYFRAKVPIDIRSVMGERSEIRYSLKTTDFKEAKELCRLASVKADAEFKRARILVASEAKPEPSIEPLSELEIYQLAAIWLIKEERKAENWAAVEVPTYDVEEREMALENLNGELMEFASSGSPTALHWSEKLMENFLKSHPELCIEKGNNDYQRLSAMLRRAQIEKLHRRISRLEDGTMKPLDKAFQMLFAHSPIPETPKSKMTLKQLTEKFMEHQRAHSQPSTIQTYSIPVKMLIEVLGGQKQVSEITKDDIIKVGNTLMRLPSWKGQRFADMTLLKAIAKADAENHTARLSAGTVSKYMNNVSAIFNFIEEDGVFTINPVKSKRLKAMFRASRGSSNRQLFKLDELKKIFNAPLYTGCENDERGFNIPGPNRPRRARFWLPLMALYQGARLNEMCQLYCEDIKEEDGVSFLYIRETLDDHEVTDKNLKTDSSVRKVPIHPELVKMGFLQYVDQRRQDGKLARLFPELRKGKSSQRYSSVVSSWFARFVKRACEHKPKAVFHSFRHHTRSSLAEAGVGLEVVDAICGWEEGKKSMASRYLHLTMKFKAESLAKVKYDGLDLSHLYTDEHSPPQAD